MASLVLFSVIAIGSIIAIVFLVRNLTNNASAKGAANQNNTPYVYVSKESVRMKQYYWDLEREIFNQCFDNKTKVFNWRLWFDRCDEIIHTAPPDILADIDKEFIVCGDKQIRHIRGFIKQIKYYDSINQNSEVQRSLQRLKSEIGDTEILLNLPVMYSYKNGVCDSHNCPPEVLDLQQKIEKLINTGSINQEELADVEKLCDYIVK